jgi:tRNA dimethylallyltransferase
MADRILVITGPTASGKSAIALEVARRLDGEIISLDSRQVYRGLDIGTAKPTPEERLSVPHHGLDLVDPGERYSAGRFAHDARRWLRQIRERGRVPIVAGGTGFFLRALTSPLFAEPALDPDRRERLKRWFAARGPGLLRRWATLLDPAADRRAADPQRLARRLEVALLTGRSLSWWHANSPPAQDGVPATVFLLELPRSELYRRIDVRVEEMIVRGLVAEVRELLRRGYGPGDPGMNATGYIELISHLYGERSLEQAIELIQNATRGFARRQLTWFRQQLEPDWIGLDARLPAVANADRILTEWRRGEQ